MIAKGEIEKALSLLLEWMRSEPKNLKNDLRNEIILHSGIYNYTIRTAKNKFGNKPLDRQEWCEIAARILEIKDELP